MTSNALFISVAESMVILRPICQVGWLRASDTPACSIRSMGQSRKGPPEAVRVIRRNLSPLLALQALEDGRMLAIHRQNLYSGGAGGGHDYGPAHDQRFLVGDGQVSPALDGRQRRPPARPNRPGP